VSIGLAKEYLKAISKNGRCISWDETVTLEINFEYYFC